MTGSGHSGHMRTFTSAGFGSICPCPYDLSDETAALIPSDFMAAFSALFVYRLAVLPTSPRSFRPRSHQEIREADDIPKANKKKSLLFTNAASPQGMMAVQLAAKCGVGRVVALCAEHDMDFVLEMGAHEALDSATTDLVQWSQENGQFHGAFDCQGGPELAKTYQAIRKGGMLVSSVCGPTPYTERIEKEQQRGITEYFVDIEPPLAASLWLAVLLNHGWLRVPSYDSRVFELDSWEIASEMFLTMGPLGKVVFRVSDGEPGDLIEAFRESGMDRTPWGCPDDRWSPDSGIETDWEEGQVKGKGANATKKNDTGGLGQLITYLARSVGEPEENPESADEDIISNLLKELSTPWTTLPPPVTVRPPVPEVLPQANGTDPKVLPKTTTAPKVLPKTITAPKVLPKTINAPKVRSPLRFELKVYNGDIAVQDIQGTEERQEPRAKGQRRKRAADVNKLYPNLLRALHQEKLRAVAQAGPQGIAAKAPNISEEQQAEGLQTLQEDEAEEAENQRPREQPVMSRAGDEMARDLHAQCKEREATLKEQYDRDFDTIRRYSQLVVQLQALVKQLQALL
ncbi:hypothetical protein QBC34DRAFT_36763 [Podospora aff. communis PSN243]|uniref:Alcohol dehydrogenase-like C-terminal domain-containing protein n=1 Tax=Podospora aff. communis PSN243 TaxID=3040156 RepID=A0AAV9GYQ2_9PEZI|nr:hypothetical protein QBC34DRAFT_36763 [Podospora aff. communis PSN243]